MLDYSKMPNRSILILDAKSFYASAHCSLLGLDPYTTHLAVVGSLEREGSIVLAASIALKRDFGVSNVSRYFELPKDPRIKVVKAQMGKYLEMSIEMTKILNRFAPFDSIFQYSVDECWIDVTSSERLFGDKWTIARKIKEIVWDELRLPLAIGIGPNMLVSKLCLDIEAKKTAEGIAEWKYEDLPISLFPVDIRKMWGIGQRMTKNLNRLGIRNVGHLAHFDVNILEKKWGIMGRQLWQHCWGIDTSTVRPNYSQEHKSYGNGITLLRDYHHASEIKVVMRELVDEVTARARKDGMAGRTISVGIGYSRDIDGGFSRSMSIDTPTNFEDEMYQACEKIFDQYYQPDTPTRNVYVALSNLSSDQEVQLDLFNYQTREKKRNLAKAIDHIRERYGSTSLLKASSLTSAGIALDRGAKIGGHYE
ncbi:MAG TPA: UV damage repair protein UvrX [Bacillota bacterium]|nr:UV damage repair protein UvrX [Bacillota bacterium]